MPRAAAVTCACCANCRAAIAAAAILLALAAPATGQWRIAEDTERLCVELTLCSGSNLTWFTEYTYDSADGCAVLARKGLKNIRFYGDSFMRHLYVASALTLSGNYKSGALQKGVQDCDYNNQFSQQRCREKLNYTSSVCDGAVTLKYGYHHPPVEMVCGQPVHDSLALWTIGNHPLNGDYSTYWGVNSVAHHEGFMTGGPVCPYAKQHPEECRLWWVTGHQRLNMIDHGLHTPQESRANMHQFSVGMRRFFEAGHCGAAHVVDVFNMTNILVYNLTDEAAAMTYDSHHWSAAVNLLKTQILFNDMETFLPDLDVSTRRRQHSARRG